MRRRTIRTTKLLAIAITAAGCASTTASPPATSANVVAEPPVAAVVATPVDKNAMAAPVEQPEQNTATPVADTTPEQNNVAAAPPPIPTKPSNALLNLRGQLANDARNGKAISYAKYRPLCDANGYPLVGNINRKGPVEKQASEFCADVRSGKAKATK